MQSIADELFVGNKLAAGLVKSSDGTAIDLRNIRSPIVVFCSKGDNITPPQQALGWILQLYDDVDEIRSYGQTIVYSVHESVGHLGVFVSGGVARKQYGEFANNIDLIDVLPPGLYEAVFEEKSADTANPEFAPREWVMRCEVRTLDDIRALGGNDIADDRRFATVARMSEANLALYRTFAQPFVRACVTAPLADLVHRLHPARLQYELMSDANPFTAMLPVLAGWVREHRRPVSQDNPFLAAQEQFSRQMVSALDAFRDSRDGLVEQIFLAVYGSPAVQAWFGIDPSSTEPFRRAPKSALYRELVERRMADLKARIPVGGIREATIRALIYVGMGRTGVDARGFEAVRRIRREQKDLPALPLAEFKTLVRDQFYMLLIDQEAAMAALPGLLPEDMDIRRKALALIRQVLAAPGGLSRGGRRRACNGSRGFLRRTKKPAPAPNLAVVPPPESALRDAS